MATRDELTEIKLSDRRLAGTLIVPATTMPGFLFVHGWAGNQSQYLERARTVASLGCVCLTFDLHGHALNESYLAKVTREDNLNDVVAAYDLLAANPAVDPDAIGVIGSSYGGYLGAILTTQRKVRWLGLRAPALYRDQDWTVPKLLLDKRDIATFRRGAVGPQENRALAACAIFKGDVLIVESEHDDIVPAPVITNYREAFEKVRSLSYRVIEGGDHALSRPEMQTCYTKYVAGWVGELVARKKS